MILFQSFIGLKQTKEPEFLKVDLGFEVSSFLHPSEKKPAEYVGNANTQDKSKDKDQEIEHLKKKKKTMEGDWSWKCDPNRR